MMQKYDSKPLSIAVAVGAIVIMLLLLVLLAWEPITNFQSWLSNTSYASERENSADGAAETERFAGGLTSAQKDSWQLRLVNAQSKIPDEYEPRFMELSGGHMIDERCYPELQEMMDDCRNAGFQPMICSAYRSYEIQKQILDISIAERISQGYLYDEAKADALKSVQAPGYSEHQLGLAIDIVDGNYQLLDESQAERATQKWLLENSWKYGFILRYPSDKEATIGIDYEPWHYRYVGKQAAAEIYERGICLEEYLK